MIPNHTLTAPPRLGQAAGTADLPESFKLGLAAPVARLALVPLLLAGTATAIYTLEGQSQRPIEWSVPAGVTIPYLIPSAVANSTGSDDLATAVRRLHLRSGLTWGQLAEVFSVSRRAVHKWASGEKMSSKNAEQLESFSALLASYGDLAPEDVRSALLTPGPDGQSVLTKFKIGRAANARLPRGHGTLADAVARPDKLAEPVRVVARQSTLKPRRLGRT